MRWVTPELALPDLGCNSPGGTFVSRGTPETRNGDPLCPAEGAQASVATSPQPSDGPLQAGPPSARPLLATWGTAARLPPTLWAGVWCLF